MIASQIITFEDFTTISKSNEFWLWHLFEKNHNEFLEIQPLSVEKPFHMLSEIVEKTQIPIFESMVYDVIDHLLYTDNEILHKLKTKKHNKIGPVILGYNHQRFVYSTLHGCYCAEGIIEIIGKLNPEFLLKFDID